MQVGQERLRDLLTLETIITLNEAFCDLHRRRCPSHPTDPAAVEIEIECGRVAAASDDLRRDLIRIGHVGRGEPGALCVDQDSRCPKWGKAGQCDANAGAAFGNNSAASAHVTGTAKVVATSCALHTAAIVSLSCWQWPAHNAALFLVMACFG
jgi:hypothetical protein